MQTREIKIVDGAVLDIIEDVSGCYFVEMTDVNAALVCQATKALADKARALRDASISAAVSLDQPSRLLWITPGPSPEDRVSNHRDEAAERVRKKEAQYPELGPLHLATKSEMQGLYAELDARLHPTMSDYYEPCWARDRLKGAQGD